jgi:hypothetical protein
MSRYVIVSADPGTRYALLQKVENLGEDFNFRAGMEAKAWKDVRFHMDPGFPKQIQLPDYVENLHGHIIVSARFKDLVQRHQSEHLQCLPITIIDHKGRVASTEYWFLNPYRLQDAIDQKASALTWNKIDPTRISGCGRLVLDESRIDQGAHLFRLAHMPTRPVMSATLADAVQAAGMTGVDFESVDDFEY